LQGAEGTIYCLRTTQESAPRKLSFAGADVRGKTVAVLNQRQTIDCHISHSSNYQQGTGTRRGSQDVN
jgi:hypothetical protein